MRSFFSPSFSLRLLSSFAVLGVGYAEAADPNPVTQPPVKAAAKAHHAKKALKTQPSPEESQNATSKDDLTGWGTPEEQPNENAIAKEPMLSVHIQNIPLKLTAKLRRADGGELDLVGLTPMTGDTVGLDAEHPTLLSYREKVPLDEKAYAQDVSPSKGLVFGLLDFSQKHIAPLEDTLIASMPAAQPNVPTQRAYSMRGYRVDITPVAVLHDGQTVPSTPDGTPYQDGDTVQADVAFLAYYPYGAGSPVTLPASKDKYGALVVTVPALSYAVTAQRVTLKLGTTQNVQMENPVTHTVFSLSVTVLPLSAVKTLRQRKDGTM